MNRKERRRQKKNTLASHPKGQSVQDIYQQAFSDHQAGAIQSAKDLYAKVIALDPAHCDALHLMGVACFQLGDLIDAEVFVGRAIAGNSQIPDFHFNLGLILKAADHPEEALQSFSRAIQLQPTHFGALNAAGEVMKSFGRHQAAFDVYQKCLALDPDNKDVKLEISTLFVLLGRMEEACDFLTKAISQHSGFGPFYYNLGYTLAHLGRDQEAITAYSQCPENDPLYVNALNNRGQLYAQNGQVDLALKDYCQAMDIDPRFVHSLLNVAMENTIAGDIDQSVRLNKQACDIEPDNALAHWNLAMDFLRLGKTHEAASHYDWGFQSGNRLPDLTFSQPRWRGQNLNGKHLLIWCEQGVGDELLQARFFPYAIEAGAKLTVLCDPRLLDLCHRSFPDVTFLPKDQHQDDFSFIDFQAPGYELLFQFYEAFKRDETPRGYLKACPERTAYWREILKSEFPDASRIVGLGWRSGNTKPPRDRLFLYSKLTDLLPCLETPRLGFINLNYMDVDEELKAAERDLGISILNPPGIDLRNDLDNLSALVAALDLVIGAETFISWHAAALGQETWTYANECSWLWLGEGKSRQSPWSQTARLFLKHPKEPLAPLVQEMSDALADF